MLKLIEKLDNAACKKLQSFSEYTQITADVTCYNWAYWCLCISRLLRPLLFVSIAIVVLNGGTVAAYWLGSILSVFGAVGIIVGVLDCVLSRSRYQSTKKLPEPSFRERVGHVFIAVVHSVLFVAIFVPGISADTPETIWIANILLYGMVAFSLSSWSEALAKYFISCTPLPPADLRHKRIDRSKGRIYGEMTPA